MKLKSDNKELILNAEIDLRKAEEKYKLLVEGNKNYAIFIIDPKGNIETWNEGATKLIGYTYDEVLGKNFSFLYTKEAVKKELPKYEITQAKRKGRTEGECLWVKKDGTSFFADVVITALYQEKSLIGFSIIVNDISERKAIIEKLRTDEERYRILVEGVKDYSIIMLDADGFIQSVNEGTKSLMRYNEEEIIGEHYSIFYPQSHNRKEFKLELAQKKGKYEDEGWVTRKDGTSFFANVLITALYNKDKKLIGFSKITKDRTEKKQAEDALIRSEEKYRLLVEGVQDYAIFMLDPHGFVVSWNEGAKRIQKYEDVEILGKHFSVFYPKEIKEKGFPEFELAQATKIGKFENEGWRVRKDGLLFYANIVITPIYNKEKQLIGFSKIIKDLTKTKEAEDELRKSEQRYRYLVEGVKDYAIFMLDPNGRIESWNEGAKRIKGYSKHEIIGKHFSIFYPKETRESGFPEFELEQAKKIGRFEDEGIRIRKDGSSFYANVVITAVFDSENTLIGFSKITRDLSERKETEELLRKSEEKYRLLVEGVKDYAIFMLDPEGNIISWNEGAKRLQKYEEKEIIGKHFSIFYTEEKKKMNYPQFELSEAARIGKFEDEGLRVRKDGSTFYANVVITALYSNNKLVGFSKITRDLTEKRQAEENLEQLNTQLEQRVKDRTEELSKTVAELKKTNTDLDNFIYTASHDLKAPVSNIEGLMYTLIKRLNHYNFSNPDIDRILEMINKSVTRFQNTIKDLTAVNESQRSDKEDKIIINLEDIVDDVVVSIDHIVKESKAQIELDIQNLVDFKFSKVHMRSIIYNFLTNAIKYRSPDRTLKIKLNAYKKDNFNVIEVSDNGLGIKEENKDKVFQMFKRLHNHVEGSGIGLYIVKRIVENAGGRVEIQSEINKGTTFKVLIPEEN